jgi:5-methylcytosine-specific restriction protein A
MTSVLAMLRTDVTREHVLQAIREYDRLGPDVFFATHGYGASRSYQLVWRGRPYPHKAILGTAYELATGHRLDPGDFEGGKSGAVAVLRALGFTVEAKT